MYPWYGPLIDLKLELLKSQVIASAWRGALLGVYRLTFIANAVLGPSIKVFSPPSASTVPLLSYGSSLVEIFPVSPLNRSSTLDIDRFLLIRCGLAAGVLQTHGTCCTKGSTTCIYICHGLIFRPVQEETTAGFYDLVSVPDRKTSQER